MILEGGGGPDLWSRKGLRGEAGIPEGRIQRALGKNVGLLGGQMGPEDRQGWSMEAAPRQGIALSDLSPALPGELYDLDATSLQLKVLQYVSP